MNEGKNCAGCTGCGSAEGALCGVCCARGGEIALTEGELSFLSRFRELPFLPVARARGGEEPFFPDPSADPAEASAAITWLRLKGLITVDYDEPLRGFAYPGCEAYPVRGSMALTASGQAALDSLDILGVEP